MIELVLAAALALPVHDTQIVKCNDVKQAKKLGEEMLENGLLAEMYDVNGDGKGDILALSPMTGSAPASGGEVPHTAYPLFYVLDADGDGRPDTVLVDKDGRGSCESIVEYQDLRGPITPNSSRAMPNGGRTGL